MLMLRFVPHWLPFGNFWLIFTGIAFVLAGCAIGSGIRDVLAAKCLALMLLVFEAAVEIPPVFMQPHSQSAWGGALYNLTAIGVCLIFAEFVAGRRQADQPITSASENIGNVPSEFGGCMNPKRVLSKSVHNLLQFVAL